MKRRYQVEVLGYLVGTLPPLDFKYDSIIYSNDKYLHVLPYRKADPLITYTDYTPYADLIQITLPQYYAMRLLPTIEAVCAFLDGLEQENTK